MIILYYLAARSTVASKFSVFAAVVVLAILSVATLTAAFDRFNHFGSR